ncbi:MAG: hypothetical protein GDA50_07070 [Alphaproteobacteria bacterium GM202ARS2]|nr:hypothetical protein [Alphaproteobacteria bacterium GM202ARS2]
MERLKQFSRKEDLKAETQSSTQQLLLVYVHRKEFIKELNCREKYTGLWAVSKHNAEKCLYLFIFFHRLKKGKARIYKVKRTILEEHPPPEGKKRKRVRVYFDNTQLLGYSSYGWRNFVGSCYRNPAMIL